MKVGERCDIEVKEIECLVLEVFQKIPRATL